VTIVFINYRTGDQAAAAAYIEQGLSYRFGHGAIFRASRSIPPGDDFEDTIPAAVREADARPLPVSALGPSDRRPRNYLNSRTSGINEDRRLAAWPLAASSTRNGRSHRDRYAVALTPPGQSALWVAVADYTGIELLVSQLDEIDGIDLRLKGGNWSGWIPAVQLALIHLFATESFVDFNALAGYPWAQE
jgi:hypothetical protein